MRSRMDEMMFNTIKLMMKGGATEDQIRAFKPISRETMRRVKRTESYSEYVKLQKRYSETSRMNRENRESKPEVIPNQISIDDLKPETDILTRISEILNKQADVLEMMLNKVTFIVDELTK